MAGLRGPETGAGGRDGVPLFTCHECADFGTNDYEEWLAHRRIPWDELYGRRQDVEESRNKMDQGSTDES